jgi:glycosyltransferase involved in cell wall biosynthesis
MKICVLIPSYNEESEIAKLIHELQRFSLDIVIVDDGSQDRTAAIAESCGAKVLRNIRNMGKGATLSRGFDYILNNGYDAVITMDGDGQHRPEDLPEFLAAAEPGDAGILIGNRMLDTKNMPFIRVVTNKFMSWLISRIANQKIHDTQCGYRLIKAEVLKKIKIETANFEAESEILIKASEAGFKIRSVPVETVYAQEKSQINPFIDTFRFLKFIIRKR